MKKTFALVMAALMTASMTTVAFAKEGDVAKVRFATDVYVDKDNDGTIGEDDEKFTVSTLADEVVAGASKLYYAVEADYETAGEKDGDGTYEAIKKLADVKNWKISTDWSVGEAGTKPYFDYVKIAGDYGVYLVVEVPSNDSTKNKDLNGTIGLGKTTTAAKDAKGDQLTKVAVTYGRDYTNTTDGKAEELDKFTGAFTGDYEKKGAVVKFDKDAEEIDIEFADYAVFTVDVTGQGKLDLRFDTKFNADFGDMYDYANLDFLNFKGEPRFNRNGKMVLTAEPDTFLYEVTPDGAKEVKGAEYDETEGGFVFTTRALKSYVISDVELTEKTETTKPEDDKKPASSDVVVDNGKPNPDTGR